LFGGRADRFANRVVPSLWSALAQGLLPSLSGRGGGVAYLACQAA
jgi:hypothetical protein